MDPVARVLDGFWTWVGDYVIGTESNRFIAVHKSGTAQINVKFHETYTREQAAQEIVDRCHQQEKKP